MKKVVRKLFLVSAFDKEEKWLNEMSANGFQLCEVGFCRYVFEEGIPGEYVYRLELLDNAPKHCESVRYIQFVEDTGAEQIGSMFRWVYFRKKAEKDGFDLYSDIDSRIKHLDRMLVLIGIASGVNLFNGVNLLSLGFPQGLSFNIITGLLCLTAGIVIGIGFLSVLSKRRKLYKEKILHE